MVKERLLIIIIMIIIIPPILKVPVDMDGYRSMTLYSLVPLLSGQDHEFRGRQLNSGSKKLSAEP